MALQITVPSVMIAVRFLLAFFVLNLIVLVGRKIRVPVRGEGAESEGAGSEGAESKGGGAEASGAVPADGTGPAHLDSCFGCGTPFMINSCKYTALWYNDSVIQYPKSRCNRPPNNRRISSKNGMIPVFDHQIAILRLTLFSKTVHKASKIRYNSHI